MRLDGVDARYELLKGFLGEMAGLFSDEYVHLGGDEVVFGCWFNDPKIAQWAASKGFSHGAQIEQVPPFSFFLCPPGRSSFFVI
jgi:N-acetyl-beta-hexosaminidase